MLLQYVDHVAQKLAAAASLQDRLTVKVTTGESASALAGGYLYIGTELIREAASEAELAGIIAHLLGHIALWDDNLRSQLLGQTESPTIAEAPLIWYAGCQRLSGPFVPLAFAKRQGELESRADQLALDFMDKAGYDPGALVDFFERTQAGRPRTPSVFRSVATLPASIKTAADARRNAHAGYIVTTSEFIEVQKALAALTTPVRRPQDAPSLLARDVPPPK